MNDILIGNTGASIGKIAIVDNTEKYFRTTFQKSVAIVTVDNKIMTNEFLRFFLMMNAENLERVSSGSGQKNLLLSQLREFKIICPELSLQHLFVTLMENIYVQRMLSEKQSTESENFFESLLQKAFTGELIHD